MTARRDGQLLLALAPSVKTNYPRTMNINGILNPVPASMFWKGLKPIELRSLPIYGNLVPGPFLVTQWQIRNRVVSVIACNCPTCQLQRIQVQRN